MIRILSICFSYGIKKTFIKTSSLYAMISLNGRQSLSYSTVMIWDSSYCAIQYFIMLIYKIDLRDYFVDNICPHFDNIIISPGPGRPDNVSVWCPIMTIGINMRSKFITYDIDISIENRILVFAPVFSSLTMFQFLVFV